MVLPGGGPVTEDLVDCDDSTAWPLSADNVARFEVEGERLEG